MEDESYRFMNLQHVRQQYNPKFQPNPTNKSTSCPHFLLKFVVIALFLCFIPLFPSEPPDFISETIFAKAWELIHLLVIGIVLSYGLFCRRKAPEQVTPKLHSYQQLKASVLHHSSFFDYEDESLYGKFSKNVVENESRDVSGYRVEPYVVVRRGSGETVVERPLGLPVRSLRSMVVDSDSEDECESEGSGESSCSNSSGFSRSEKGENLEGVVGSNGLSNGWDYRRMREGSMERNGGFDLHCEEGENFEVSIGSNAFPNGWKSRSPKAGFVEGNGGFELHCEEGENFEASIRSNVLPNGWNSQSMKAGLMEGNGDFELHCGKGENFEASIGSNAIPNGWKSRSRNGGFVEGNGDFELHCGNGENFEGNMVINDFPNGWNSRSMRAGFMDGNDDHELHCGKGENFEGLMGSNAFPNGLKSRSMRAGFIERNGDFGLHCEEGVNFEGNVFPSNRNYGSMMPGFMARDDDLELGNGKGENLEGNGGVNAPPNGGHSRSMRTGFMAGNNDFDLDCGKSDSFEGNVGNNPFPNEWNSQSMSTGYMADNGNVESGDLENLEGNVRNSSPVSWKSRSMRSDFMVNNAAFVSELSKSRSFRSPVQAGASSRMDASFCSWLPGSPNMVEGNSWRGVANMPFSNFQTQDSDSNLMGSSPTLEKCTTSPNFFVPSTATPPSMSDSTSEFASKFRMYNHENGNSGNSPIQENANMYVENSTLFMPSAKDGAQPISGFSLNKHEEDFMPRTPEIPPSVPRPSVKLASSARASRQPKSKLRLSGKKNEQQLGKNIRKFPVPMDDVTSPINESFQTDEFRSSVTIAKSNNLIQGPSAKEDSETPKDDVLTPSIKGPLLNKNERSSTPVKWDEDCFTIPLSENNDTEDLVQIVQDNPTPNPASLTEAASSTDSSSSDRNDNVLNSDQIHNDPKPTQIPARSPSQIQIPSKCLSSRVSCDEQDSQQSVMEKDVQLLKETKNYLENEGLSKENEGYKTSIPLPPQQLQIRANDTPVESSSTALSVGFLLDGCNDLDRGSPPNTPKKEKALSKSSHSRRFSCTSFFDRDLRKSFKDEAREEDQYVGRAGKCGCLSLDVRPTLSKAALKGKSVRTIRPREVVPETTSHNVHPDQSKENNSEMVVLKIGISEKRPSSNGRKREKQGNVGTSIIVGVSSKEGSSGKAAILCDVVKEEEPDSEIDKKADEFIAKFKEQIRLQKVATRTGSSRRQLPQRNSLHHT